MNSQWMNEWMKGNSLGKVTPQEDKVHKHLSFTVGSVDWCLAHAQGLDILYESHDDILPVTHLFLPSSHLPAAPPGISPALSLSSDSSHPCPARWSVVPATPWRLWLRPPLLLSWHFRAYFNSALLHGPSFTSASVPGGGANVFISVICSSHTINWAATLVGTWGQW